MGVFDGYRWPTGNTLNEFKRFNIVYGSNGTGKTTLSRLFSHLVTGECAQFSSASYSLETEAGTLKESDTGSLPVRVFNADYVRSNIGEIEGELNPIFIIGEDQKDLQAELAADQKEYEKRQSKLAELTGKIEAKQNARGKEFTQVAKVIGAAGQGLVSRTYRKQQAENAYSGLKEFKVFSDDEVETLKLTAKQKKLDSISKLDLGAFETEVSSLAAETSNRLAETVEAIVIPKLRDNPNISKWVESGIELHSSGSHCEFCGSVVSEERLKALAAHFNDADKSLKEALQSLIANYDTLLRSLETPSAPSKMEFFDEFQTEYTTHSTKLTEELGKLVASVKEAKKLVETKLASRTEAMEFEVLLETNPVAEALRQTNEVIGKHNAKSKSFEEARTLASTQIEQHYLSTIQSDVEAHDSELDQLKADAKGIRDSNEEKNQLSLDELDAEIKRKRGLIANTQQAAEDLTKKLEIFLGRKELRFDPEGDGYRIYRKSVPAQGLSEGEKTAIAFVYFSVQLEDQDFDKTTGIVVVDDPISSLDASSTYQAFAFLKEAVKDSKQVFLLTHNFDFLKLLLNWIKHHPHAKNNRGYYMLKAKAATGNDRKSWIEPMDEAITKNGSEYVFLFKQVRDYTCDGTIENAYPMPNIIRKLLEQFLEFMCPTADSNYHKLQSITFDPIKKTALNKYANDFSHPTGKGLDPSLVDETRNNAQHLIEMIQTVAPTHYQNLNRN